MSVLDALARMREQDARCEAPPRVEAAVLAAYRDGRRRTGNRWWLVAAAAAVTLFALLWTFSTRPKEVAIAPHRTTPAARSQPAPVAAVTAGRNPGIAPVRRRNRLLHVTRKAIQAPNRRTLYALTPPAERDGFVAVPYAPPFPTDEFEVVRVSLATGAKADVVAGVDGIVRAVRWVD